MAFCGTHALCPLLYGGYVDDTCDICGSPDRRDQFCPLLEHTAEMDDSDEEPLHEDTRGYRGFVFDN